MLGVTGEEVREGQGRWGQGAGGGEPVVTKLTRAEARAQQQMES